MAGKVSQAYFRDRHLVVAIAFLALAVILGGGGTPNPETELWLEILAVLAALAWLWIPRPGKPVFPHDRVVWLVAAIVVLLPLAQLVPLPPAIWTQLPGRETQVAALGLVDAAASWQPVSMSPMRTLASLLSLGPPLLMLGMTAALDPKQRNWLLAAVAAMALLSAALGALQLAGGESALRLYDVSSQSVITGFQANRNAEADILLIGLLALAPLPALFAAGRKTRTGWLLAAALVLALATVLTASRTGIALLPLAVLAAAVIATTGQSGRRSMRVIAASVLAVGAAGFVLLQSNTRLQQVAARFGLTSDGREGLWTDSIYVIGQYWSFGSGMGTFVPSFIAAEPLEAVDPGVPNRAHNDYLELLIEAGLWGVAALVAVAALLGFMAFRAWRTRSADRAQILFGIAALLILALHSIVDYPLRSMALACFAAVAAGMFARPPGVRETSSRHETR